MNNNLKLEVCKKSYEELSKTTSDITRYLGFVGIAIIWIFKIDVGGNNVLPIELRIPAFLIVLGLTIDLVQYFTQSLVYYFMFRDMEENGLIEKHQSPKIPNAFWWLWFIKVIIVVVAYCFLFYFLFKNLW